VWLSERAWGWRQRTPSHAVGVGRVQVQEEVKYFKRLEETRRQYTRLLSHEVSAGLRTRARACVSLPCIQFPPPPPVPPTLQIRNPITTICLGIDDLMEQFRAALAARHRAKRERSDAGGHAGDDGAGGDGRAAQSMSTTVSPAGALTMAMQVAASLGTRAGTASAHHGPGSWRSVPAVTPTRPEALSAYRASEPSGPALLAMVNLQDGGTGDDPASAPAPHVAVEHEHSSLPALPGAVEENLAVLAHSSTPGATIGASRGTGSLSSVAPTQSHSALHLKSVVATLAHMSISVKSVQRLLDSFLDVEKLQAGLFAIDIAVMSPRKLLHTAAQQLSPNAAHHHIVMRVEADAGVPSLVLGDFHRLLQVCALTCGALSKLQECRRPNAHCAGCAELRRQRVQARRHGGGAALHSGAGSHNAVSHNGSRVDRCSTP